MASKLVAFIIGAGSNVGASVADKFRSQGYKIALGSRNPKTDDASFNKDDLAVKVDAHDRQSIVAAFEEVGRKLGPVNLVVYNAASLVSPPSDILTIPAEDYYNTANLGLGAFTAAQEALKSFRSKSTSAAETEARRRLTFIVTGNALPFTFASPPTYYTLGIQKALTSRLVATAAQDAKYAEEGVRFYFATLATKDLGIPPYDVFRKSGKAHADVYWELVNSAKQEEWDQRFTTEGERLPQKTV